MAEFIDEELSPEQLNAVNGGFRRLSLRSQKMLRPVVLSNFGKKSLGFQISQHCW